MTKETKRPKVGKLYRVVPQKSQGVVLQLGHFNFLTLKIGTCLMITVARKETRECTDPRTDKKYPTVFWITDFLCLDKIYENIEFPGVEWSRWFEQIGE